MKRIKGVFLTPIMVILSFSNLLAQEVEMADAMRSNGKIYVIVAIILIVLVGLIGYLFLLDRKISQLEREIDSKSN